MISTFAAPASAQGSASVVSACSGVSLPRSVVTDILAPVFTGLATPIEERVNDILGVVQIIPLVGTLLPPLDTNVAGLLNDAAAGDPVTLQVFDTDGNPVDAGDPCDLQADSLSLADEGGIAIGGNRISGLGANGETAFAGDLDAIALGNGARVETGATGSIALGQGARATAANSAAIGAGATATRGQQLAYAALEIAGPVSSVGEVSVGAPGAERQITNVAPGSAPTDAVNVAQLQNLADAALRYDSPAQDRVTLGGAGGTVIDNVAPGALAPGSREAVNGAQLHATNGQVATNTVAIASLTALVGTPGSGGGAIGTGAICRSGRHAQ